MALCALLAFWTGGDHARVDSLFRQSGLLRPKWDEVHYADGRTYGEVTVARAIAGTDEFYEPSDENESWREGRVVSYDGQRATTNPDQHANFDERPTDTDIEELRTQVAHLSAEVRKREDEIAALRETLREQEETSPSSQADGDTKAAGLLATWVGQIRPPYRF